MNAVTSKICIDLQHIPPQDRHLLVLSTFGKLPAGEALEIVDDRDPGPLRFQIQAQWPGQSSWRYLESGPQVWRVAIARKASAAGGAPGACCGACGCA